MTSTVVGPITMTDEAQHFAEGRGVAGYLPALLEMTARLFPDTPVRVHLTENPFTCERNLIRFDIDSYGWKVRPFMDALYQWTAEFVDLCPPDVSDYYLAGSG